MAKKPGVRALNNKKKNARRPKAVKPTKIKLSHKARKKGKASSGDIAQTQTPQMDAEFAEPKAPREKKRLLGEGGIFSSAFLAGSEPVDLFEDEPVRKSKKKRAKAQPEPAAKSAKENASEKAAPPKPQDAPALRSPARPRSAMGYRRGTGLAGIFAKLAFWKNIGSARSSRSALSYASSSKHMSKTARRNRKIVIFAGGGALLVAAVLLIVFLVPWGASDAASEAALADQEDAIAVRSASPTKTPDPTPAPTPTAVVIVTTPPDPTRNPIDIDELVDDFKVEADLYYNEVGYSNNHYEYTSEEIHMMAQMMAGEAGGEPLEGKIAVGNVVINRVFARGYFGSTVKSVIAAPGQFDGYDPDIDPHSSVEYAARKVLNDEVWTVPQNVYYFNSNKPIGEDWYRHKWYKRIGGHNFYTDRYPGRSNIKSIPPPLFERTFKWPRYGCKPEKRVYRIQYMLKDLGYKVDPDSYFGMDTVDELKSFQGKKGLEADGIAGPSTIEALIRAFGLEKFYKRFYV